MQKVALKFPTEVSRKLALPAADGVARVTPFELAAALTKYYDRPFSPEGFGEDLFLFFLAQHAAHGIISAGNWRLKAYHSGLDGFVENHLQIDKKPAGDWLACLLFLYFTRYGKASEVHSAEMARGFGAFLSLADISRIGELPDLYYRDSPDGERPPLLAGCIVMYLEMIESAAEEKAENQSTAPCEIEIYFDKGETDG